MIQVKCIEKLRDKNNKIYGYKLQDLNQQTRNITSGILKDAIRRGEIDVVNLKLTADNKLIDRKEQDINNLKIGKKQSQHVTKANQAKQAQQTKLERSIAKALIDLDLEVCNMGDNYIETVEDICEIAGIEFNPYKDNTGNEYIYSKAVKAYEKLIKDTTLVNSVLIRNINHYYDNSDTLYKHLILYKVSDLSKHKILNAVNLVAGYTNLLYKGNKITKEYKEKISKLLKRLRAVNLNVCYKACKLSQTYKEYLDNNIFIISNDKKSIGEISLENSEEYKIGIYTSLVKLQTPLPNGVIGYLLGFNGARTKDVIEVRLFAVREKDIYMKT